MNTQTINIPQASRDEIRLVLGIARMAVQSDQVTYRVVNKVSLFMEGIWVYEDQLKKNAEEEAKKKIEEEAKGKVTTPSE